GAASRRRIATRRRDADSRSGHDWVDLVTPKAEGAAMGGTAAVRTRRRVGLVSAGDRAHWRRQTHGTRYSSDHASRTVSGSRDRRMQGPPELRGSEGDKRD